MFTSKNINICSIGVRKPDIINRYRIVNRGKPWLVKLLKFTAHSDNAGLDQPVLCMHLQNRRCNNSYTMCCPPVRGDNPRALASGLSYALVDKHGITILPPTSV